MKKRRQHYSNANIFPKKEHLISLRDLEKLQQIAAQFNFDVKVGNVFVYFTESKLGDKDWIFRVDRRNAHCRIGDALREKPGPTIQHSFLVRMGRIINGIDTATKNKAFDIIQKKAVNIFKDILETEDYEDYLAAPADHTAVVNQLGEFFPEFVLTKTEYYFIKEVLLDARP